MQARLEEFVTPTKTDLYKALLRTGTDPRYVGDVVAEACHFLENDDGTLRIPDHALSPSIREALYIAGENDPQLLSFVKHDGQFYHVLDNARCLELSMAL